MACLPLVYLFTRQQVWLTIKPPRQLTCWRSLPPARLPVSPSTRGLCRRRAPSVRRPNNPSITCSFQWRRLSLLISSPWCVDRAPRHLLSLSSRSSAISIHSPAARRPTSVTRLSNLRSSARHRLPHLSPVPASLHRSQQQQRGPSHG